MKNIFFLLYFLLSFHNIKSFSFNTEVPSVERKYVNAITSDSLGNNSIAHAIPVYQRPTGRDSILTQAVNTASSLSGTEKFEMLFSTTGYGFESDLVNHPTGINNEFIPRIEAFHYSWGWGITGLSVIIPWDKFEPTPGNYQLNALQKVIDYCDTRGFTLSIKFWAVRSEGDGFLQPSEMVKGSLGRTFSMVDIPGFRDVYPSYGCDRTNVLIFNAVKKIAEKLNTYSRAGYMCLAGGHTEELVNHVIDNGGASSQLADFSEDNLARFNSWVSSRGITSPGTPPMIHGNRVSWPHPNFSQPLGLEFSRFLSYNLGKYERNFVNAVKSVSNIPTLYYYAASSNSQLRATSNANMNYIGAANDGMYGSEGDGVYDHQGKFRCNSINLGNFPNGISAVEFDPDDCSTWRNSNAGIPPYCHNQFDLNTVKNSMEALYSRGTRYIHLTMAYCPTEILTMSNMMQQLHQSYIGKTYVRPVINSFNTVSVEVTQKYRNSEDLLSGIDFTNKYVKYTDNDFWGGISPDPQTCTPPAAPMLTTSANTISLGQSATLNAVGCSGNLNWSTGQTTTNISVSPTQTTTYSATCTVNGCTSPAGSVTIIVSGTPPTNINCSTLSSDFGSASCDVLSGWIYDSSNPNTVVNLDIYEGNTLIQANIPASNFRQDLLNAGIGNGYHAFQFATPSQLKTGQSRNISLRASGCSYVFTNSPKVINCNAGARVSANFEPEEVLAEQELTASPNPNKGDFIVSFQLQSIKLLL